MSKNENKTVQNSSDVREFIAGVAHKTRKENAETLLTTMEEITGEKAAMWGSSIIGFGKIHYKYKSGREGDWMAVGFSPRKSKMSIYLNSNFPGREELEEQLGKYKRGKACLYVNKLADVDESVLREMIERSYKHAIENQQAC